MRIRANLQTSGMDVLRIRLFGRVELELGDRALPAFPTRVAKSLFCYLTIHRPRMFPRSVLLGEFWPDRDESAARRNLRTALWRIRRVIEPTEPPSGSVLRIENDCIGFAPETAYWLDVEAFETGVAAVERAVQRGMAVPASAIEDVLAGYRADLLDELYDDWCTFERERLRLAFLTTLERLAQHHADASDWSSAVVAGRRLLQRDPLREHVHRLVMRCLWRAGNRAAALQQYEACARLLRDELDVPPMRETTALRDALLRDDATGDAALRDEPGSRTGSSSAAATRRWAAAGRVMRELDAAATHLEHARSRLSEEDQA
jgi:DNA-binding SARP family transcriptional activator